MTKPYEQRCLIVALPAFKVAGEYSRHYHLLALALECSSTDFARLA